MATGLTGALACLAALLLPAQAPAVQGYRAACNTAFCGGVSEDGSRAVFPFAEELTKGAERTQIYERSGGVTRALVPYPDDAPNPSYTVLMGLSADARHVFVHTALALVPEDRDGNTQDIYDISGGTATLLSTGPLDDQSSIGTGPGAPFLMFFAGASADGEHAFFNALGPVVPEDTDGCPDLYERFGDKTKLVSTGPTATASYPAPLCDVASFAGLSSDGSHVFFTTYDHLIPEDEDGEPDIYQRVGDALPVLTTYPDRTENCVDRPEFGDASADGSAVLFSTSMPIAPGDDDFSHDVYKRGSDGSFTLVSRGTPGSTTKGNCSGFPGDRPVALSADGSAAVFETSAGLSPEDSDSAADLYRTDDSGAMSLITTGPTDPNVAEQTQVFPIWSADFSDDLSRIAFESRQAFVAGDEDGSMDVYLRAGGQTELVSVGPSGGNGNYPAELLSISADGQTVAFSTRERLTDLDTDGKMDFYLRRTGQLGRPGSASASKRRRQRRTVLISAESIAPRMRLARVGRVSGRRQIGIRLGCPKTETSGPCHGVLRLVRHGEGIGRAGFRVWPGRSKWVDVRLRGRFEAAGPAAVLVRVRGVDRLGNRADVSRRVVLERAGRPR